jgi:UDP-N-acetylglucosamine 2-epimerase (non-hydrolysing)
MPGQVAMANALHTVLVVMGTRPEAIKLAPIVRALKQRRDRFRSLVCAAAQHRELLDQVLALFRIKPDMDLDLMTEDQTLAALSARGLMALDGVLADVRPDLVLVQGDTTTAMMAALAAYYRQIPVGHVEAGLRTGLRYRPFPEEMNRRVLGDLASVHFAPTARAREALLREGIRDADIYVTGNTAIDAVQSVAASCERGGEALVVPTAPEQRIILVTAHRREHFGGPLEEICRALLEIARAHPDVALIYPVHLNPHVREPVHRLLGGHDRIHLIPPVNYAQCVALMLRASLILTDSGGMQEEAAGLHRPVLVMRETTERMEGIEAGAATLVGTSLASITEGVTRVLSNPQDYERMRQARNPYGDGHAAERIVEILDRRVCGGERA